MSENTKYSIHTFDRDPAYILRVATRPNKSNSELTDTILFYKHRDHEKNTITMTIFPDRHYSINVNLRDEPGTVTPGYLKDIGVMIERVRNRARILDHIRESKGEKSDERREEV